MPALQLWLPNLTSTLAWLAAQRDRDRAFTEWQGEDTVWLLPNLDEPFRWQEDDQTILAIPAEHLDRVDIHHISENGYVWGPGVEELFPGCSVEGLLDSWLNMWCAGGIEFYPAPDTLRIEVPHIENDEVTYRELSLVPEPGPALPLKLGDNAEGAISLHWPPDDSYPATVSPEGESREIFGPLIAVKEKNLPIAKRQDGDKPSALRTINKWPKPLTALFPPGSGIDDIHACASAKRIAKLSQTDMEEALRQARTQAATYISDGKSDRLRAWFLPVCAKEGEQNALVDADTRFNLSAASLNETLQSEDWRRTLTEAVSVHRVWGATGLLWALFLERLKESRAFRTCEHCGRIIRGQRNKRFCGRNDDIQCFRQRRKGDRSRERLRSKK